MKNKKINENTTLKEILKIKKSKEVLEKYNFPCLFCPMASFEMENLTLGEICKFYGLNLKTLLKELNNSFPNNKEEK